MNNFTAHESLSLPQQPHYRGQSLSNQRTPCYRQCTYSESKDTAQHAVNVDHDEDAHEKPGNLQLFLY